jgi:hypothetical protein
MASPRSTGAVTLAVTLGAACTASAQAYRFVRIADTRDGPYALDPSSRASINAAGSVGFWRQRTFDPSFHGIYHGMGIGVAQVAGNLDGALAGAALTAPVINDSGQFAFYSQLGGVSSIWRADPGSGLTLIAQSGAGTFSGLQANPSFNNSGAVAFRSGGSAYVNAGAGNVEIYGPTVPAGFGVSVGSDPHLNNLGQLSLSGGYALAVGGFAHLRGGGGPPTIIADGATTITTFLNDSVNDAGTVVFGSTTTSGLAIWRGGGAAAPSAFVTNDGPYDRLPLDVYSSFGSGGEPAQNNVGTIAFLATLDAGGSGIFTGPDPETSRVIQSGSTIFGRTVSNFFGGLGRDAVNAAGEIAFQAELLDTSGFSQVVVKAVPVPDQKWSSAGGGTWSTAGNWLGPVPDAVYHSANFTDAITAPAAVTVDGAFRAGTILFDNANSYTIDGGTITLYDSFGGTIRVLSGSHRIGSAVVVQGSAELNVAATAGLRVDALRADRTLNPTINLSKTGIGVATLGELDVDTLGINAGTIRLMRPTSGVATVRGLDLAGALNAWTVRFDVDDASLIIDYTAHSPVSLVLNQLKTGYAGGAWTGNGIASTAAAIDPLHAAAVGVAQSMDLFNGGGGTFGGVTVDSTALLLRHTLYGDANLDAKVDIADFGIVASRFNTGSYWARGDFNYDGVTDIADFSLLASNYNRSLPESDARATPEPAALLMALVGAGALRRRERTAQQGR